MSNLNSSPSVTETAVRNRASAGFTLWGIEVTFLHIFWPAEFPQQLAFLPLLHFK